MSVWNVASLGVAEVLAQSPANPTGPEFGKASPVGLVVIMALLIGIVLLVRSMNKKLGQLPETFEPEHPEPDQALDEGTDRGAVHEDSDRGAVGQDDEHTDNPPNVTK
ncbi:hypothetical protein G4H71_04310 [Rhodococcus triatomae]|uniref:Uncharacterized protein n=1 Tax=Rhodococcus triatomae TaxID=300028 RepID=A0A1G7ZQC3_9NOCA|nr:hypothetical protein [Rhodococcus triatomae]QNG17977.1 hypothetical protein G4H72_03735 [Rhodococcus triatomae]QNG22355.1 hypothetical protein G4H71_04310 [Rhodococcus triatomae]SDH10952.1 hypothetical protein SAMN05444695_101187 [Rhodococcus triatomae]